MDPKQAAAFWPLYQEYDAAQSKLTNERLAIIEDYAKEFVTKKVLPTIVVVRFFQVENQMQLLADLQISSHLPIIEETGTE